jgi:hypothetical protein
VATPQQQQLKSSRKLWLHSERTNTQHDHRHSAPLHTTYIIQKGRYSLSACRAVAQRHSSSAHPTPTPHTTRSARSIHLSPLHARARLLALGSHHATITITMRTQHTRPPPATTIALTGSLRRVAARLTPPPRPPPSNQGRTTTSTSSATDHTTHATHPHTHTHAHTTHTAHSTQLAEVRSGAGRAAAD